ncbi:serine carboxypeptidase 3, partial [Tanacetum coccineum]
MSKGLFKGRLEYAKNDFSSYAGKYIPAFAARVQQGNKANEGTHINLKRHTYLSKLKVLIVEEMFMESDSLTPSSLLVQGLRFFEEEGVGIVLGFRLY